MNETKPWYESKSILINLLMGAAMIAAQFYPPAADFIKQYFAEAGIGWSVLNMVLRLVSKDKITIS